MNKKSKWNYRVVAHLKRFNEKEYWIFGIHEVFYEDDIPISYTKNPIEMNSYDGLDTFNWMLDKMMNDIKKPILNGDDFPNEFNYEKWKKQYEKENK